jgi:DNA-directed RNA polymerase specialized sigma24 family protein
MNEQGLTRLALDRLLGLLDADKTRAAKKYEQTRRALIKYFESRGCHTPEDLADRTIDRVARRVGDGVELWGDEPSLYFYGVARHVLQEYYRRSSANYRKPLYIADDAESLHRRYDCMARCLEALAPEHRELLVEYCSADRRDKEASRRALAAKLGISINTLRLRVHRLRANLARSVRGCERER